MLFDISISIYKDKYVNSKFHLFLNKNKKYLRIIFNQRITWQEEAT
jgi:hypothetical protein